MTYEQAQEYLINSYGAGRKKGMDAVAQALAALGDPQDKLKIIHVAGTNGKGSFCAMMASILREAGYNVGMFTSPHIEVMEERFDINGQLISHDDFVDVLEKVAKISQDMFEDGDCFSFFELLTIMAFVYFQKQGVDFLLLEVGIGGRLDATNVISKPFLTAIMRIGFDHMEILGNTLTQIAAEKGGIIKENVPLALYDDVDMVYNVFKKMAGDKNVKIYHAKNMGLGNLEVSLLGEHQRENARVVLSACAALMDLGVNLRPEHIRYGLKNARHPARMEIMGENPTLILEGAHNLQGALACACNMRQMFAGQEITVLIGILKDKEIGEIVTALTGFASRVVFTRPMYEFKAATPQELQLSVNLDDDHMEQYVEEDCIKALHLAQKITPADGVILCTGSLYLMGDIRKYLRLRGK
ncbi:MAG: bifunctional folylpolyglutamate synthase/dihydrofolate synthase [Defluviitaleaceae bacterium]|nr:bifunctional folylpolyglutamate synthase/dihydrofolate synthase [Defluviitaleaceae bacterium]